MRYWSIPFCKQFEGEIQGWSSLGQHPQRDDINVSPTELGKVAQCDTPTGFQSHAGELGFKCSRCGVQLL